MTSAQVNVTGEVQESGGFEIRETLWQPNDQRDHEPQGSPPATVLEQGSSVIAPGGSPVPLAR